MKPYRVLVVDDSAFMRKIISDLIEKDANFQVAATAANGREAIEKVNELAPDLVTMDVEMPEMNGLEALKIIMAQRPLPVIMLSGINEEGMKETILALEWGAFDFIRKPSISNSQDIRSVGDALREQMKEAMLARRQREARASADQAPELLPAQEVLPPKPVRGPAKRTLEPPKKAPELPRKLTADKPQSKLETGRTQVKETGRKTEQAPAAKALLPGTAKPPSATQKPASEIFRDHPGEEAKAALPGIRSPQAPAASFNSPPAALAERKNAAAGLRKLVAVGCSTGGPRALKAFLEDIPADFPAPIVIVQHMPPNFTKSLAQRLNTFSPLEVAEAEQGMILRQGSAYIAPGGYHLRVVPAAGGQYAVELTLEEARNGHRPSVDTLFESILPLTSLERHAVLMTGMGSDGARMMKSLYDSGVTSTFAESEETCVVYGMPRSAVELKCVRHVLPLHEIAPRLVQAVK
ncbi:chemotaxis response regulator protein-glutamate methylesterase [Paenibacillus sp. S150]|uniref:protein-glutamate methylesterase/protein-glutamine glutaminase n=1 Tax=Paenibacillus sp. S150 TaxID=2749826 RepID=UPI001C5A4C6C|nr:chemotaxis response regulator protein-glutamate methylesterase [Paenibacillus sp. S150]MBW4083264.1 chemotaxis-specific protein-glutamate methyltransferase CheB [Paenibacillus sp. S150]